MNKILAYIFGLVALIEHVGVLVASVWMIFDELKDPSDMPFGALFGCLFIGSVIISIVAAVVLFNTIKKSEAGVIGSDKNVSLKEQELFAMRWVFIAMTFALPFGVFCNFLSLIAGPLGLIVGPLMVTLPYFVISSCVKQP